MVSTWNSTQAGTRSDDGRYCSAQHHVSEAQGRPVPSSVLSTRQPHGRSVLVRVSLHLQVGVTHLFKDTVP